MLRIRLVHWNRDEAEDRAGILRAAGYEVQHEVPRGLEFVQDLKRHPPAALVIDLGRLPSQGRDLALHVRKSNATRNIPLVFVGGGEAFVARLRAVLSDAVFTTWGRIRGSLKQAILHPPARPCVPESVFAGYSGTPLPKKLGIKPGFSVNLVDAPPDFERTLCNLPPGVGFRRKAHVNADLILWFVTSRLKLERGISRMVTAAASVPMWIIWPKKTSKLACDLGEQVVRETGLASGLVDYKICAVDATWSGLLFRRRKRIGL